MGDQRRRSKSKGCQKEQEEDEEGEVCGRVYTERAWLLLRVHSKEGGGRGGAGWGNEDEGRQGQGAGGEQRRRCKEKMKRANDR